LIFDKTGTLTHGRPELVDTFCAAGVLENDALQLAASLEQYSKHPLATGLLRAASTRELHLIAASEVNEMRERDFEAGSGVIGCSSRAARR
jgi:cation transport ATPase